MSPLPPLNGHDSAALWERFRQLLWHDADLGFWLDVSRMALGQEDLAAFEGPFARAFAAMEALEGGPSPTPMKTGRWGTTGCGPRRWPPIRPWRAAIASEVDRLEAFGRHVLAGTLTAPGNRPFTDVLWIGIGGSGLGPLLMLRALQRQGVGLPFHFFDNVDPDGMARTLAGLAGRLATTLVIVVSKSGGTPEPHLGMVQARARVLAAGGQWNEQAVAVTMAGSQLDQEAAAEGWLRRFDLFDWVGGRTSITSAVGLLPAALIGADLRGFLEGAAAMDRLTRVKDLRANPAALLAASWHVAGDGRGRRDMVVLPYRDRLEVFSRYLQQLVMESLGKRLDREGRVVHQGLAVYGNKGSTDQHAYVQQLRDGLDNFFVTFIEVLEDPEEIATHRWRVAGRLPRGVSAGHPGGADRAGPPEPQHQPAALRCPFPRGPDRPVRAGRGALRRTGQRERLPPAGSGGGEEGRRRDPGAPEPGGGPAGRWPAPQSGRHRCRAGAGDAGAGVLAAAPPLRQHPRLCGRGGVGRARWAQFPSGLI